MAERARLAMTAPQPQSRAALPRATTPAWRVTTAGDAIERGADSLVARATGATTAPSRPAPAPSVTPEVAHAASLRGGEALPPGLARDFGRRFGQDFSDVRLHRGPAAAAATRALATPAFAVGRSIHIAPQAWRPTSPHRQLHICTTHCVYKGDVRCWTLLGRTLT